MATMASQARALATQCNDLYIISPPLNMAWGTHGAVRDKMGHLSTGQAVVTVTPEGRFKGAVWVPVSAHGLRLGVPRVPHGWVSMVWNVA